MILKNVFYFEIRLLHFWMKILIINSAKTRKCDFRNHHGAFFKTCRWDFLQSLWNVLSSNKFGRLWFLRISVSGISSKWNLKNIGFEDFPHCFREIMGKSSNSMICDSIFSKILRQKFLKSIIYRICYWIKRSTNFEENLIGRFWKKRHDDYWNRTSWFLAVLCSLDNF